MIKSLIFFCLVFLQCIFTNAQETFYDFIKPGNFQVGFQDTLVFDSIFNYKAYNYNGDKPYFIQIWHPVGIRNEQLITKNETQNTLIINDLFEFKQNPNLELVQQQIKLKNKEIYIRDFIAENLNTGQANDFGILSYTDIFDLITNLKTQSCYSKIKEGSNFPVIVYHHGSQSNSFENFAMAEYFASKGFIFVASNFHLPYENSIWGLKPYDKLIKNEEEESLQTVLKFAQSLSNSSFIFYIGHSLGAQMGFRTFDNDSTIKGMVSLETTIEFAKDYEKIKEMWPEVFQKIVTEKANYPFPVMLCAAAGQENPFVFFDNLNAPQITIASTKVEFEHNAYTSMFCLRYFLGNSVPQTDKELLKDRLILYAKHIELISEFLINIMNNVQKDDKETVFVRSE
ncbi:MAG: alpha/beta hydrolase [Lentimicrobium sp.]|nr:alpha/beta hydrolase [Lentimicrobium sp.]